MGDEGEAVEGGVENVAVWELLAGVGVVNFVEGVVRIGHGTARGRWSAG